MKNSVFRRNACRLCDGRELELALRLAPTPIADAYISAEHLDEVQETFPLDVFLCHTCGHVQLLDIVDPEVLFGGYVYVTSISLGLVEHFRRYTDDVLRCTSPQVGAFVVEIGSNDGTLLKFFQDAGMRVLGIDPARAIAHKAMKSGIETLPTFFTSELARRIKLEHGPAAVVCANNVFAHADSLADMAEGVRELLAPDGVFVFEVSYVVDIVQRMLFDTIYHEHLCYHSAKPLDNFFCRHGMELIDIQRIASKGGSLRATAQLAGGSRAVSPRVVELITLETMLGFDRIETFRAFATKIESVKTQLLNLVCDLKAQGKTVAGYGASATVTTLIHHFDLGDKLRFIVDDNPMKQNSFSPGHHIPVLSPHAIYERETDYVLILAWNYFQPIVQKHQTFLKRGGHFILPLPEVKVI